VFAEKANRFMRRALALKLIALLLSAPLCSAQEPASTAPVAAAAEATATNRATKNAPASLPGVPIPSPTKRKAGFLAGSGLAILSLLALAAGLALVRTFKR
jgi:hypothetical protein